MSITELVASLREKFDKKQAITMHELDLLIRHAEEAVKFRADLDALLAESPANGSRP